MTRAVRIPVTVKMRAGWNDSSRNAPDLARRVQDAGAAAVTIHGRTAEQSYTGPRRLGPGGRRWPTISTFPSSAAATAWSPTRFSTRLRSGVSGVLVGRGVLRNPWILAQAAALARGETPAPSRLEQRGEFLRAYIRLLLDERVAEADGFRHQAPGSSADDDAPATRRRVGVSAG